MNRPQFAVALVGCVCTFGCSTDESPAPTEPLPAVEGVGTTIEADAARAADAIERLSSPSQDVRDGAAAELRELVAKDPVAAGDPGEAYWKAKLAAIGPGITLQDLETATGGRRGPSIGDNGGSSTMFRLDDYWTTIVRLDRSEKLRELGPLTRSARAVWVAQPAHYNGKWVTYFVNGVVARDIQFANGGYERFTAYFDNGRLAYEQRYGNGEIEGPEVGFHRDGTKAYEGVHVNGKRSGRWVHWYANGTMQSDQTYVNGELDGPTRNWRQDGTQSVRIDYRAGKETGQAAWDEQGKLLYARGSAADAKTEK